MYKIQTAGVSGVKRILLQEWQTWQGKKGEEKIEGMDVRSEGEGGKSNKKEERG